MLRQGRYTDAEPETLAGYTIVSKQQTPSVSFLRAGREDLAAIYEATNRPEEAAKYRTELSAR